MSAFKIQSILFIMAVKLTPLEYKVLNILKEDSRRSASSIAKELQVSRATIAKTIKSLRSKNIKFSVEYWEEGELAVFAISKECLKGSKECYKLVDGRSVSIIRGSFDHIQQILEQNKIKNYLLAVDKVDSTKVIKEGLYCDYCGGEIKGTPITLKVRRRIYYTCCNTCKEHLRKKLSTSQV